jgi:hypothetical protein
MGENLELQVQIDLLNLENMSLRERLKKY